MNSASEVHQLALQLPQQSRLKLDGQLLRSVEGSLTPQEFLVKAAKRDAELENGTVKALDEGEFWSGIASRSRRS